jgi:hypothetical protein
MWSFSGRLSKGADLPAQGSVVEARYRSKPVPTIIGHAVIDDKAFLQVRVPPEFLREVEDAPGGEIQFELVADESVEGRASE